MYTIVGINRLVVVGYCLSKIVNNINKVHKPISHICDEPYLHNHNTKLNIYIRS